MLFVCHPKILRKHCLQFLLGVKMAPRETGNNAYSNFWGDKQRALWYVVVFSGVVNFHLVLVGASISHFVTAVTKFSCCSSKKRMSPLFFISRSNSLSPFFSLSFAGLPPTFSFSPSVFLLLYIPNLWT